MKALPMIEAFARLDGVEFKICELDKVTPLHKIPGCWATFNPVVDDALNLKARDKHRVEIEYNNGHYIIKKWIDSVSGYQKLMVKDLNLVKFSVIKCILMANNLWVGE